MRETHRQSTFSMRRAAEARQDEMAPEAESMGDKAPRWLVVAQGRTDRLLRNRRELAALPPRHLYRRAGHVPAHLWHRAGRDRLPLAASGRDEGRADRRGVCGDAAVWSTRLGMRVCLVWYSRNADKGDRPGALIHSAGHSESAAVGGFGNALGPAYRHLCEGRSHEVSTLRAPTPPTRRQEFPRDAPGGLHLRPTGSALRLSRLGALDGARAGMAARAADGAGPRRSRMGREHEHALRSRRLTL